MKVIMRLYRQHDLDLIYLYKADNFSFQKHMKAALHAYLKNEQYQIDVSSISTECALPKRIQFHLCLSESKDLDIIKWIEGLSNGYRNSLLKNVFRNYISSPIVEPYLKENKIVVGKKKNNKPVVENNKKTEKELLEEVLSAPNPSSDPNFKPEIIKDVLLDDKQNNKQEKHQEVVNTKNIDTEFENKEESESFDFFDEFETMINNF